MHDVTVLGSTSAAAVPLLPFSRTRSCSRAMSRRWWTSSTTPLSSMTGSDCLMVQSFRCNLHHPIGAFALAPILAGEQHAIFQLRPLHHRRPRPVLRPVRLPRPSTVIEQLLARIPVIDPALVTSAALTGVLSTFVAGAVHSRPICPPAFCPVS